MILLIIAGHRNQLSTNMNSLTINILAFGTARITLNDKYKEIKDPKITIPRRHLGQCQENRHKLKVLKEKKVQRRKKKARKLICPIPYYLCITIDSGQHSGWLLDYQNLPSNISSTSYLLQKSPLLTLSDCLALSREGLGWGRV